VKWQPRLACLLQTLGRADTQQGGRAARFALTPAADGYMPGLSVSPDTKPSSWTNWTAFISTYGPIRARGDIGILPFYSGCRFFYAFHCVPMLYATAEHLRGRTNAVQRNT